MSRIRRILKYLFGFYMLALAFLVFVARPDMENPKSAPKLSGDFFLSKSVRDIVYMSDLKAWLSNLFLLIPLAFFLNKFFPKANLITVFLWCVAASCAIEITQIFVPGRVPDARDVLVNSAGVMVWLFGTRLLVLRRSQERSPTT